MSLEGVHPLPELPLILQTVNLCRPCLMSSGMTSQALVAPLNVFNQRAPCMCCGLLPLYDGEGFRRGVCSAHTNSANVEQFKYSTKPFPQFGDGDSVAFQWFEVTDPSHGQWFPAKIVLTKEEGVIELTFREIRLQKKAKKNKTWNVRELIEDGQLAHFEMIEKQCYDNGITDENYYLDLFPCVSCPSVAHRECFENGCLTNYSASPEPAMVDSEIVYQCQSCVSMHKKSRAEDRPTLHDSVGIRDFVAVRRGKPLRKLSCLFKRRSLIMMCYVDKNGEVVTIDAMDVVVQKRPILDPTQYQKNSRAKRERKDRRRYRQCEIDHHECCGIYEVDQEAMYNEYESALEKGPEVGELFIRGLMHTPPPDYAKLFHTHIGKRIIPSSVQKCIYCSCQPPPSSSSSHPFKAGKCPEFAKAVKQATEFWGQDMANDKVLERKRVKYFLRSKSGFPCEVCHDLFANTFNLQTHGHAMNV